MKAAVKALLAADATLAASVKKWLSAEPAPQNYPALCFGWVEWAGGRKEDETQDGLMREYDNFYVVILEKHPVADTAETDALTLMVAAEDALEADRTLGAKVTDSIITMREKQAIPERNFSICAVRLTLQTWRWVQK